MALVRPPQREGAQYCGRFSSSGGLAMLTATRRASRVHQGSAGRLAARIGRPFLPNLLAARFAQQKIFQDEFAVAGSKRRTANPARYFAVTSLRSFSALTT